MSSWLQSLSDITGPLNSMILMLILYLVYGIYSRATLLKSQEERETTNRVLDGDDRDA
jgi:hypothetical protein